MKGRTQHEPVNTISSVPRVLKGNRQPGGSRAVAILGVFACALSARQAGAVQVLTYHNDNARTGQNLSEVNLTLANVNPSQFGKLFSYPVDGYVYTQPLYMPNLPIPGQGIRNVVFVATQHDSVYAFDADGNAPGQLWTKSFINPPAGITPVPQPNVLNADIVPEIGITGTPVIDPASGTLYVVAKTKEVTTSGEPHFVQRLHALDVTNGAEKFGGPATIGDTIFNPPPEAYVNTTNISVPGTGLGSEGGQIKFNALRQNQRPGLVLAGNRVYVAWASHGDTPPYHGWVVGFNKTTLAPETMFNLTPNGKNGGIWMSGGAPAVDDSGNMYLSVGNGTFALTPTDTCGEWQFVDGHSPPCNPGYGDSVLRLSTTGALSVADFFTPFNQAELERNDQDLGSAGVLLLPGQPGGHPHMLVTSGKGAGKVYLIDRDNMGGFNPASDNVVQVLPPGTVVGGSFDTPAYFNTGTRQFIYYQGLDDVLKAFELVNGMLSQNPVSRGSPVFGFPGATPSISANGTSNAIAWAINVNPLFGGRPAVLFAYDATATPTLTTLYSTDLVGARDQLDVGVKFIVPTVANGKVYVGTQTALDVLGLFPPTTTIPDGVPSDLTATAFSSSQIDLSWVNHATNATGIKVERSLDGASFTQINTVNRNATTYRDSGLTPSTTYFYRVRATNQVGDSAPSNTASARTKPTPPILQVADIVDGEIILSWTSAPDHVSYTVERSTDGVNFTPIFTTVDASTTSFTDSGLAPGTYIYRVQAFGSTGDSSPSNTARATIGPLNVDHSANFADTSDLRANGNTHFVESVARLTDIIAGQAGTFFTQERIGIRNFTTTFKVRIHEGTFPRGDGFAFVMQSSGANALGRAGGQFAYFPILNGMAVVFDVLHNSTGIVVGRHFPAQTVPGSGDVQVPLNGTPINLQSQTTKQVALTYDGTTLAETITDLSSGQSFSTSYTVDIRSAVRSDSAFVGFSGGTALFTALQDILTWSFQPLEDSLPPRAPDSELVTSVVRHDHNRSDIAIAWKAHNSFTAQGYNIERSTDGAVFTQIASLPVDVTTFTDEMLEGSTYFYRVRAFDSAQRLSAPLNVASAVIGGGDQPAAFDHGNGFAQHADLTSNGSAFFPGTHVRLTDDRVGEDGTVWIAVNSGVGLGNFTTAFTFQVRPGVINPPRLADGFTFTIQGNDPSALGGEGGGLGYFGIRNSVAVKFDLIKDGGNETGLYSDGHFPGTPAPGSGDVVVSMNGSGVDILNQNPKQVVLTYGNGVLTETVTDLVTRAMFNTSYQVDIPSKVVPGPSNLFYVGFTGGTGGLAAVQDVLTWSFEQEGTN